MDQNVSIISGAFYGSKRLDLKYLNTTYIINTVAKSSHL